MWLEIGLDAKLAPYHCWKGYFIHLAYNTPVYTLQYPFFLQEDDNTDSRLALICLNIFWFLFLYFFSRTGVSSFTFTLLLVMAASAEMHFTQPNCILFLFLPISTVCQVLLKFLKL